MRAVITGLSLVLLGGTAVRAACDDPQNQFEINQCAGEQFDAADQELNTVYKQLTSRLDEAYVPKLRQAQRAWITFRDAECEFESMGWEGGSGRPAVETGCRTRLTGERSQLLNTLLTCDPETFEGNMECPRKQ